MKKTLIAATVALAVSLAACGKNDAPGNAATSNDSALDGTIESGLSTNEVDGGGNVTIAEDGSIVDDAGLNGTDAVANAQ